MASQEITPEMQAQGDSQFEQAFIELSDDDATGFANGISCRELRLVRYSAQLSSGEDKPVFEYEFAGHQFLGDHVQLYFPDVKKSILAQSRKLTLDNGVKLTYGQISALAGDFFATTSPISDPEDPNKRMARFVDAWNTLGNSKGAQKDVDYYLGILQAEIDAVTKAALDGKDPAEEVYPTLAPIEEKMTTWKKFQYAKLAFYNWDHFGDDARKAYTAGHTWALQQASKGFLEKAYTINAFADHYLQDLFSAGHMRTPRRYMHDSNITVITNKFDPPSDMCAKDCALGLDIGNESGDAWTAFGDKQCLSKVNEKNMEMCKKAIDQSVKELVDAFNDRTKVVEPENFGALKLAPTRSSAESDNQLVAPLFTVKAEKRRIDVTDRKKWEFISYNARKTLDECRKSGLWKQPIH